MLFFLSLLQLQSKRELFFKNELPTSGGVVAPQLPSNGPTLGSTNTAPTPNPSAIKESITKRGKKNFPPESGEEGDVYIFRLAVSLVIIILFLLIH